MDSVFLAVADPTRRQILERLRIAGPLAIKEISRELPMSRQAVTKHLDLLVASNLVRSERVGRQRLHRLSPAPLREVDAWLKPYAEFWDSRLERLQRHLKEER